MGADPQYEAKVGSGITTGANPGSDWSERGAEAPGMVGAFASPTTTFGINILTPTRIISIKH
jgi:hypothetical protein